MCFRTGKERRRRDKKNWKWKNHAGQEKIHRSEEKAPVEYSRLQNPGKELCSLEWVLQFNYIYCSRSFRTIFNIKTYLLTFLK